jgi:hypothetical protein
MDDSADNVARLAAWREADEKWLSDSRRPLRDRDHFQVQEIAEAIARLPERLEVDRQLCRSVVIDLFQWICRKEFTDDEVLFLVGKPQLTAPFLPTLQAYSEAPAETAERLSPDPESGARWPVFESRPHIRGTVHVNVGAIILTRAATRRYLDCCNLPGARRVLNEWFQAVQPDSIGSLETDRRPSSRRRGRIPQPVWKKAKAEAMRWLDENSLPEPGDGGKANLEKHIADWLKQSELYPAESTVRLYVTGWIDEYRARSDKTSGRPRPISKARPKSA